MPMKLLATNLGDGDVDPGTGVERDGITTAHDYNSRPARRPRLPAAPVQPLPDLPPAPAAAAAPAPVAAAPPPPVTIVTSWAVGA